MLYLREISITALPDSYVSDIPAIRKIHEKGKLAFGQPVTFFTGENGSGKSTLLEAIAVAMGFNAEGGSKDNRFSTRDTHSGLSEMMKTVRGGYPKDGYFLRAESFYNMASHLEDSGSLMTRYGGISLHSRSHGEAFMAVVTNRFSGEGLYLLDEPESALSPRRLLSLLVAVDDLVKRGSQFIIATHSPVLLACPKAEILEFSETGIHSVSYRETDSYRITKEFLESPERMLHYLMDEE